METIYWFGRDNARTPVQWDDTLNAGFSKGKSWINCNPNYKKINVKESLDDPDSIYNYYKKLIILRKNNLIFIYGNYRIILEDNEKIYAYIRKFKNERLLVILNFYEDMTTFKLPSDIKLNKKELLISNYNVNEPDDLKNINLKPYEARVYKLFF